MRIVFVAYHGSVHTVRWVSFFAERGHEVHVVTCGGGTAASSVPYRVHDLGPPRFGKLGYLFKILAARRMVRALRPDVVHAHYATSYGALAVAAGVKPLIVTAHGDDVLISPRSRPMRRLVREVLRRADLVTVPGDHMAAAVRELVGAEAASISVFQYGIDAPRLAQVSATRRSLAVNGRGSLRIVSARPLMKLYRVDSLVDALAILSARGIDFSCEIIGDGPERPALERQARAAGLSRHVRFCGAVPPDAVEKALADADVYVSLSESDGTSITLLEAMVLGAVPVLSDIPANRPWATKETTVLVSAHPSAVADGIERAARMDREDTARRNRQIVFERADLTTNLGRFESVVRGLGGGPA